MRFATKFKTKLSPINQETSKVLSAEISHGVITGELETEAGGVNHLMYMEIESYSYSKALMKFDGSNMIFKTRLGEREYEYLANLGFLDRQKLYLMMGDHVILKDGNFKWLIGGFLGFLFYLYTDTQVEMVNQLNKVNQEQMDQVQKLWIKLRQITLRA